MLGSEHGWARGRGRPSGREAQQRVQERGGGPEHPLTRVEPLIADDADVTCERRLLYPQRHGPEEQDQTPLARWKVPMPAIPGT